MTICAACNTPFTPRRSTARYCSTACRMAAHRLSVTADAGPSAGSFPLENRTSGLLAENGENGPCKPLQNLKKISVTNEVSETIEHHIGPHDWPINILGGYRASNTRLERELREKLLRAEVTHDCL